MKITHYALVGSWDWDGCEESVKGISLCSLDAATGNLSLMEHHLPNTKIGSEPLVVDDHVYFVEEIKHTRNRKYGGGGYVYHGKIHNGTWKLLEQKETLACNPCYCAIDKTRRYLLIAHYASTRDTATKLAKDRQGNVYNEILYDDAAVVLYRLHEDGSFDAIVDFAAHDPKGEQSSLLHSVYQAPFGNIFIVFDKGLDQVYSYTIDYEKETLVHLDTLQLDTHCDPRYCAFHPRLHKLYSTNEKKACIYTINYDPDTGKLQKEAETCIWNDTAADTIAMSSDIKITPDGKYVYVAIRGIDQIAACELTQTGIPKLKQNVSSNGRFPRGLGMNKDGSMLYSCNTESDNITSFEICQDGSLLQKAVMTISRPANITMIEEEQ